MRGILSGMVSAKLVVQAPGGQRHEFPLIGAQWTLGRGTECDLVLDYGVISRQHCRVERTKESYLLIDLGSTNGTFVNGRRIKEMQLLVPGDEIAVGDVMVTFFDASADQVASTLLRPTPADAPIRCDSSSWQVLLNDRELDVKLSLQEFELLSLLTSRYGRVCTREELGTAIWGRGNFDLNMLHRLIHRLKQKLEPDLGSIIVSVPRKGYKVEMPSGTDAANEPEHGATTAVILFADIASSTELTEQLGDLAFRQKARSLDAVLRQSIASHGGLAIDGKLLGDGVLATFASARDAIAGAALCHRAGHDAGLPLHVGIHAGDVIHEEGNVFGGAVNIAARVAGESAAGETLVSQTVRDLARTSAGVSYEDRGEHDLKGVGDPVRLYVLRPDAAEKSIR